MVFVAVSPPQYFQLQGMMKELAGQISRVVSEPGVHQKNFGVFGHGSVYTKPERPVGERWEIRELSAGVIGAH